MYYLVYRLVSPLIPWLGLLWVGIRGFREPAYWRRARERLGFCPSTLAKKSIWFHAVSAGEVTASITIVQSILEQYPHQRVLVTTTTPTGSDAVRRLFGDQVDHCYLPYDAVWCLKRFFKRTQPRVLLLLETELWPNLLHQSVSKNIKVYLINARLSERSATGYQRVSSLTQKVLNKIDGIATQYQDSADRFQKLGFRPSNLHVTGNLKFDLTLPENMSEVATPIKTTWFDNRICWIAASTHPDEEEIVLAAHQQARVNHPQLGLILAPRHVHRSPQLKALSESNGFQTALLSDQEATEIDVLIADQMGILLPLYSICEVAFIGGTLQGQGGHNPIEPASLGLPLIIGPDRFNFKEVCHRFEQAGCLNLVHNSQELTTRLLDLLEDSELRTTQGQAAQRVVEDNRGATDRLLRLLQTWLEDLES